MQENLVIVESPAKAKTIEKFLGKEYMVKSSFGHIRDLAKKGTKAHPYPDTPYAINKKQKEIQEEVKERKNAEAGKRYMEGFMAKFNTRFEKS